MGRLVYEELTYIVIGAAFEVWRVLGYGFLEAVYHEALLHELRIRGIQAESRRQISVVYKGHIVGNYIPDLSVEDKVIVEIKTERTHNRQHEAQLLNYLASTGTKVGLLINFGRYKCAHRRLVFDRPTLSA